MSDGLLSFIRGSLAARQMTAQLEQLLSARQGRQIAQSQEARAAAEEARRVQLFPQQRQQAETSAEAAKINLQIAKENLARLKGQNKLFDDPAAFDALVDEALKSLGNLDEIPGGRASIDIAKRLAREKRSIDPIDNAVARLTTQLNISGRAANITKGDVVPDDTSTVTGVSKIYRNKEGEEVYRVRNVVVPGMLPKTTTGMQIRQDSLGNMYYVPVTSTTTPVIPGQGKPSSGGGGGRAKPVIAPSGEQLQDIPESARKELINIDSLTETFSGIRAQLETDGKRLEGLVGPLFSGAGAAKAELLRRTGKLTRKDSAFLSKLGQEIVQLRKDFLGTAVTAQEKKLFEQVFPNPETMSVDALLGALDAAIERMKTRRNAVLGSASKKEEDDDLTDEELNFLPPSLRNRIKKPQ